MICESVWGGPSLKSLHIREALIRLVTSPCNIDASTPEIFSTKVRGPVTTRVTCFLSSKLADNGIMDPSESQAFG